MKHTMLCFLLKDDRVLLAMKKRGFGAGKWNGIGGKLKEKETLEAATVREVKEEIGVIITTGDLEKVGVLSFRFKDHSDWEQDCFVFTVRHWQGEPKESEEMRPQWYTTNNLPFQKMWIDDPHWLPLVLAGKKIKGEFLFDHAGSTMINFNVSEVLP